MTASDVIKAVRHRLGDVKQERWADSTLALYVSLCQQDICIFTNYYKKIGSLELVEDQLIYKLPDDTLHVDRLEYMGKLLPIESRAQIDADEAQYPCALKDNLQYNEIEFVLGPRYAGYTLSSALAEAYGVSIVSDSDAADTSECELEDTYGLVVEVTLDELKEVEDPTHVTVYYSAVPAPFSESQTELVLPDIWFIAFLHYVTGMALQDDNDANNIQRGDFELKKYDRQLAKIFKTVAKDHTSNMTSKLNIPQRRF